MFAVFLRYLWCEENGSNHLKMAQNSNLKRPNPASFQIAQTVQDKTQRYK